VPRLSIVIPCLRDSREFEDTLASVLQNRPDDCEVLVPHAQDYADPYRLKGEVGFLPVPGARRIVTLLNAGFDAARSAIIHVVQCGLEVDDFWTDAPLAFFADESVATVAPVIVDAQSRDRVLSAGLGYSRRGRHFAMSAGKKLSAGRGLETNIIGPTLAAGFYRRSWWRLVRWDESMGDEFADAHFNIALARLGATTRLEPTCIVRAARPLGIAIDEPFGFAASRRAERLFWSHTNSSASGGTIALRAALSLIEAVAALPSPRALTGLLGRLAGLLDRSAIHAVRQRLEDLEARLAAEKARSHHATISLETVREYRREKQLAAKKRAA